MGKPGPACSVCSSEHRHSVDVGLTHRLSHRALAARFNLSADAIGRHAQNHLSPVQKAAILAAQRPSEIDLEALQARESEGLLNQLVTQRARLQSTAEMAARMGDVRAAVSAEGAITANLQLVARLLGQLVTQHNVTTTSLLISPDYLRLRSMLVQALRPYPEAARAVAQALHAMESEAAADITASARAKTRMLIEHTPTHPGKTESADWGGEAFKKSGPKIENLDPQC